MKITTLQLPQQLQSKLAPIYYLGGEEMLLLSEAKDDICRHASAAGFDERIRFDVDASFVWDKFLLSVNNLSIFSDKKLIELHLYTLPNAAGSTILQNYVHKPQADIVVVIINVKNDANVSKQTWFKELLKDGMVVQTQEVASAQLPMWITNRARQLNLKLDGSGIQLLADYTLGNLYAVKHELEKLQLLYGTEPITLAQLTTSISDNANFDVFDLLDTILSGNINRTLRILETFKYSGIEPPLILWAIARELRNLIQIHYTIATGKTVDQALEAHGVWSKRKPTTKHALTKHNLQKLSQLLQQAKNIDFMIKGAATGDTWLELTQLCLKLAPGKP